MRRGDCYNNTKLFSQLIDELCTSESVEDQTGNAHEAPLKEMKTEQTRTVRANESLKPLQQIFSGILANLESSHDSMVFFISEESQTLEAIVRGETVQSLKGLLEILWATAESVTPRRHRAIT